MVSVTIALLKYSVLYMNMKQDSSPIGDEVLYDMVKFHPFVHP